MSHLIKETRLFNLEDFLLGQKSQNLPDLVANQYIMFVGKECKVLSLKDEGAKKLNLAALFNIYDVEDMTAIEWCEWFDNGQHQAEKVLPVFIKTELPKELPSLRYCFESDYHIRTSGVSLANINVWNHETYLSIECEAVRNWR